MLCGDKDSEEFLGQFFKQYPPSKEPIMKASKNDTCMNKHIPDVWRNENVLQRWFREFLQWQRMGNIYNMA